MVSQAVTTIKDGAKYRITCQRYDNGCVVLGEKHDAAAFLYYATNLETVPEDAWWVLSVKGAGFTMKNAATGQYMVYKSGKLTNDAGQYTAKGIQLSNTADDNYAVWTLTETTTGMLIIENAGAPGQYFNLRTDGSYLLGTYSSASTDNGFFQLYDEQGNQVVNTGGTTGDEDALSGLSGVNKQGEYWERTGLAMPVVVTTNVNDPILYRIRNVRSGQFVYAPDNELTQSEENSTKFYFTACGSGVNVYTQDKKYVSTYYTYYNNGNTGLTLASGTTGENVWSFGFSETDENSGYTIAKKDNLPETNYYQSQYLYWNDYKLTGYRAVGLYNVVVVLAVAGRHPDFNDGQKRHVERRCGHFLVVLQNGHHVGLFAARVLNLDDAFRVGRLAIDGQFIFSVVLRPLHFTLRRERSRFARLLREREVILLRCGIIRQVLAVYAQRVDIRWETLRWAFAVETDALLDEVVIMAPV